MIERFNDMLPHLERLPAESQEEVLAYIEVLIEALENSAVARGALPTLPETEPWVDPVGAWSDLPDTMLEDFDRMRHETPPTPPIEEL